MKFTSIYPHLCANDRAENSIMQTITIAVSAILIAAGLVTAPGLINNARDNNATTDLSHIAYSQAITEANQSFAVNLDTHPDGDVRYAEINSEYSKFNPSGNVRSLVVSHGSEWTAFAKSSSGKIFIRTSLSSTTDLATEAELIAEGVVFPNRLIVTADAPVIPISFAGIDFPGKFTHTELVAMSDAVAQDLPYDFGNSPGSGGGGGAVDPPVEPEEPETPIELSCADVQANPSATLPNINPFPGVSSTTYSVEQRVSIDGVAMAPRTKWGTNGGNMANGRDYKIGSSWTGKAFDRLGMTGIPDVTPASAVCVHYEISLNTNSPSFYVADPRGKRVWDIYNRIESITLDESEADNGTSTLECRDVPTDSFSRDSGIVSFSCDVTFDITSIQPWNSETSVIPPIIVKIDNSTDGNTWDEDPGWEQYEPSLYSDGGAFRVIG